jgi:hypothetical protein
MTYGSWGRLDSNQRPTDYELAAPAERVWRVQGVVGTENAALITSPRRIGAGRASSLLVRALPGALPTSGHNPGKTLDSSAFDVIGPRNHRHAEAYSHRLSVVRTTFSFWASHGCES